jgi:hypothetical protein
MDLLIQIKRMLVAFIQKLSPNRLQKKLTAES